MPSSSVPTIAAGGAYPLGVPEVTYAFAVPYPPEVVFDFVADAENNPRWHEHVNETRWIDPPPIVVGRKARQTGHLFGRDWAFLAEVVEYDPPRRVARWLRIIRVVMVRPMASTSWSSSVKTMEDALDPIS
jgi:hypothetical protein